MNIPASLKVVAPKSKPDALDFFDPLHPADAAYYMACTTALISEVFLGARPGESSEITDKAANGLCFLLQKLESGMMELSDLVAGKPTP